MPAVIPRGERITKRLHSVNTSLTEQEVFRTYDFVVISACGALGAISDTNCRAYVLVEARATDSTKTFGVSTRRPRSSEQEHDWIFEAKILGQLEVWSIFAAHEYSLRTIGKFSEILFRADQQGG